MIELYSIRDVSRILALQEARLRYWTQTGFVGPTVRKGGRFYYTFCDLLAVKAAKDLVATGMPLQKVRKNVDALKKALPNDTHPATKLRVCCDGETIVALADEREERHARVFDPAPERRQRDGDELIEVDRHAGFDQHADHAERRPAQCERILVAARQLTDAEQADQRL